MMNDRTKSEPVMTVRKAAEAEAGAAPSDWGRFQWLANQDLTRCPGLSMARVTIRRGRCNPRHTHDNCQEVLYLLAGRLEQEADGQRVTLEPGDTFVVAAGAPHHARSVGDVDADMIVVYDAGQRGFREAQ